MRETTNDDGRGSGYDSTFYLTALFGDSVSTLKGRSMHTGLNGIAEFPAIS